jgi:hypothetical protein
VLLTVLQHKTILLVPWYGIWQSVEITEMPTCTLNQRLLILMVAVITTLCTALLLVKVT